MSTQIIGNVGCYYLGCTHPVIGQCQGYPGRCGRFCCAEHSTSEGFLCLECARKKDEERLFQLYLDAAEKVPRMNCASLMIGWVIGWVILSFLATCVIFLADLVISGSDLDKAVAFNIGPMIAVAFNIGPMIIPSIIIGIYAFLRGQKAKKQIAALTASLPSFDKFYDEWLKHRKAQEQKQALLTLFEKVIAFAENADARERRISEIEEGVRRALR